MSNRISPIENITPDGFIKGIEEFRRNEPRDAMYRIAMYLLKKFWTKSSSITPESAADIADALGVLLLTWNQAFYRYGIFDFEKLEECIEKNYEIINNFRNRQLQNKDEDFLKKQEKIIKGLFNAFLDALQSDIIRFSEKEGKLSKKSRDELLNLLYAWDLHIELGEKVRDIYEKLRKRKRDSLRDSLYLGKNSKREEYMGIRISSLEKSMVEKIPDKLIRKSSVAVAKALHLLAPHFFPLWDNKIAKAYVGEYSEKSAEKYIEFIGLTLKFIRKLEEFCKTNKDFNEFLEEHEAKTLDDINIKSQKFSILKLIDEYNYARFTQCWIKEERNG